MCCSCYRLKSQFHEQWVNVPFCAKLNLQAPSLAVGIHTQATTKPYFLLLKLLLWLFVIDEGEIFGKADRLEAPDDLQKDKE